MDRSGIEVGPGMGVPGGHGASHLPVVAALRARILRGELMPGQRMVEVDLAERLGVSRASVRAALIDLAGEGLVERAPNRGAVVRIVSLAEAIEITECRMALEGLCAAKAAQRATAGQVAELTGMAVAMRSAVEAGDLLTYSNLNHDLHRRIREIAAQLTAARAIERLHSQFVRHQFRLALRPGRPQVSLLEHERVVAAIAAGDQAAAEQAMRAHLCSVIGALVETGDRVGHPDC